MKDIHCKRKKNSQVSKCIKDIGISTHDPDIVQLQVQFVSILPCLNLAIISSGLTQESSVSRILRRAFLFLFGRISLTNFSIHLGSRSRF